jgi:magnesium transporter
MTDRNGDVAELEPPPEPDDSPPQRLRDKVADALEAEDAGALHAILDPLAPSAALRQLLLLDPEDRDRLLELVPTELAAALVEEAPHSMATELVERLDPERAGEIIQQLDSDLQADLIGDLDTHDAEAILSEMDHEDAADVRRLVAYEDETAGGLMQAEAFSFPDSAAVGDVLTMVMEGDEDFERHRGKHPYIVDTQHRPIGVVSLRALLTARKNTKLTSIMVEPITVGVDTTLDQLQDIFDAENFLGLPVVEADGNLVGVVSRDAVYQAVLERAESDSLKRQQVGDELRSMPLWLRSRRRLAWLSANIVLNVIAASVIAAYEETLAAVIAIDIPAYGVRHVGLLRQSGCRRDDA